MPLLEKSYKEIIHLPRAHFKMDSAAAEQLLNSKTITKTAFQGFPINTLAKLCEAHGISVRATGQKPKGSKKKSDYIAAIVRFVSH